MLMSQDAKKPCHEQHVEREKALNTQCKQSHAQHLAGALEPKRCSPTRGDALER